MNTLTKHAERIKNVTLTIEEADDEAYVELEGSVEVEDLDGFLDDLASVIRDHQI